ncbi:hypothetical protein BJY59DRAFT_704214 [Rhodotorula toruloides]
MVTADRLGDARTDSCRRRNGSIDLHRLVLLLLRAIDNGLDLLRGEGLLLLDLLLLRRRRRDSLSLDAAARAVHRLRSERRLVLLDIAVLLLALLCAVNRLIFLPAILLVLIELLLLALQATRAALARNDRLAARPPAAGHTVSRLRPRRALVVRIIRIPAPPLPPSLSLLVVLRVDVRRACSLRVLVVVDAGRVARAKAGRAGREAGTEARELARDAGIARGEAFFRTTLAVLEGFHVLLVLEDLGQVRLESGPCDPLLPLLVLLLRRALALRFPAHQMRSLRKRTPQSLHLPIRLGGRRKSLEERLVACESGRDGDPGGVVGVWVAGGVDARGGVDMVKSDVREGAADGEDDEAVRVGVALGDPLVAEVVVLLDHLADLGRAGELEVHHDAHKVDLVLPAQEPKVLLVLLSGLLPARPQQVRLPPQPTAPVRVGVEPVRDKVDEKVEPGLLAVVVGQLFQVREVVDKDVEDVADDLRRGRDGRVFGQDGRDGVDGIGAGVHDGVTSSLELVVVLVRVGDRAERVSRRVGALLAVAVGGGAERDGSERLLVLAERGAGWRGGRAVEEGLLERHDVRHDGGLLLEVDEAGEAANKRPDVSNLPIRRRTLSHLVLQVCRRRILHQLLRVDGGFLRLGSSGGGGTGFGAGRRRGSGCHFVREKRRETRW